MCGAVECFYCCYYALAVRLFILWIYFSLFFFFFLMIRQPPRATRTATLFPYTTLFRSRGTEQTVVVVLGHARDKLLPAHKSGLGFPRLERPGEVFVDRPLVIRKLVHAAKAEGFWQEAPDIGVS